VRELRERVTNALQTKTPSNPHDHTAGVGPNLINHIAFVIDASTSMAHLARQVIEVADAEIKHLAEVTTENGQETRVTVYVFHDDVYCLVYDKDVLRLPSLKALYQAQGNTALVAAAVKAIDDLAQTAETYGDHAYLLYLLTDGEENVSRYSRVFGGDGQRRWGLGPAKITLDQTVETLRGKIATRGENWSVAALVPNQHALEEVVRYGFPRGNVAVWDATRVEGVQEVFSATMRASTQTFMSGRSKGVRGSNTLYAGGTDQVNAYARKKAGLKALPKTEYRLVNVTADDAGTEIRPFVERETGRAYRPGEAFYQLALAEGGTKTAERIQPHKKIMVRDRKSGRVYAGDQARDLLGLPSDREVRVKPEDNPKYQIFIQSTSVNRKLVAGTKLLLLQDVTP
jgi:hypothetical protein